MEHKAKAAAPPLRLPVLVNSPRDIGRLAREIESINETLLQLKLRKGGDELKLPKTSYLLDRLIELNKLNLLHATDRQRLLQFLQLVKQQAPLLHISFSADPSPAFMEKLMAWLRQEIHPATLVTVGLQPNIGAGCIVRTTNRRFDFSLRENFTKNRQMLISQLVAINEGPRP